MSIRFAGSRRIGSDPLHEEISKNLDRPSEFSEAAKKRVKELRVDAKKLEVTFATEGWKDIIQPLIDGEANPGRTFELFKSDKPDSVKYQSIGRTEGFFNLNMILKNIVATLKVPIEDEKKKEKE